MKELQCSVTFLDKVFVVIFGVLAVFLPVFFIINKTFNDDKCVLWITSPNEESVYPMDKHQIIKVTGRISLVEIEIDDSKFRFINSQCPNKQCLNSGWVSFPMMPVVCLPNGVSAVIKKSNNESIEIDGVAM